VSDNTIDFPAVIVVGGGDAAAAIAELITRSGRSVTVVPAGDASGDLAGADLVIEATADDLTDKKAALTAIASAVDPGTAICTVTTNLSVTDLAAVVNDPSRVAGLNFLSPLPAARTVEVIAALQTEEVLVERLVDFVDTLPERVPVAVKDRPGFLVNALLVPYLNDVITEYDDELASAEDLDLALKLGLGYAIGPLELLDSMGLDEHLTTTENLYATTRDSRYAAPPLLRAMVAAGRLGAGRGDGFHHHGKDS
jgi:3-hydroxybutyryl-CoA dehydrogenase